MSTSEKHLVLIRDTRQLTKRKSLRIQISLAVAAMLLTCVHQATGADNVIEEIVVTAQKREQRLQDTPIAITAFSAQTIVDGQIDGVRKISQLTPSLVFNQSGNAANTYLRGVGQDISTIQGEPGVALFVNGVYQGVNISQVAAYHDLERIEVLRGPQGTLYGRNSSGGNINITTKKPDFSSQFEGSLLVGDDSRVKAALAGQGTMVEDRLAVRANIVSDSADGRRKNLFDGKDVEERDLMSGAVSLLWTPSEEVEVLLRADYSRTDDDTPRWDYQEEVPGSGLSPPIFGGTAPKGADEINNDTATEHFSVYKGISADITWQLGDIQVKSITAYRESEYEATVDFDGSDVPFVIAEQNMPSEQFSQEINISGTALDGRLDWITGVYYFDQDMSVIGGFALPVLQGILEGAFGLPPGGFADPGLNPFYSDRISGDGAPFPFLDFRSIQSVESYAAFVQGTYSINDSLRLTGGVRYTNDKKTNVWSVVSNIQPNGCEGLKISESWNEPTWKLGADYNLRDDSMVYASVSRGFKSGGYNDGVCGNVYDPEIIDAYEVGLKTTLADGRVQLNVAAFFYDYEDFQARLTIQNASIVKNAAKTEIKGLEIEVRAIPVAGLTLTGAVSFVDGKYKDFLTENPMFQNRLEDASGNQTLRTPDVSVNASVQYAFNTGIGDIRLRYEINYKDDYFTTVFNDPFAQMDAHTVQNVRVFWDGGGAWQLSAFVENLGDEEYLEQQLIAPTIGGVEGMWGPPRTAGIQVLYRRGE